MYQAHYGQNKVDGSIELYKEHQSRGTLASFQFPDLSATEDFYGAIKKIFQFGFAHFD
jgi:hypothetical protein